MLTGIFYLQQSFRGTKKMVVKVVATARLQWSKPIHHHPQPPSSSQALVTAISSSKCSNSNRVLCFKSVQRLNRSALFGTHSTSLPRSKSLELLNPRSRTLKKSCSASLDEFSDEEFSKQIQELSLRFQSSDDNDIPMTRTNPNSLETVSVSQFVTEPTRPSWVERGEEIIPSNIERKANSVDLPMSLRIIKRKIQWQEGFHDAGELAYCSMKKAFSSMVFIIRELHSYSLQMRELLYHQDLQGVLIRVQKEMHVSFVWLFQQVFSHTPTLMVSVMILLANYSVHSMGTNAALAASAMSNSPSGTYVSLVEVQDENKYSKFDSSSIKSLSVSSSNGETTSFGGNNGGGGKIKPATSGTDGEGLFFRADQFRTILPDEASQLPAPGTTESTSGRLTSEYELSIWNSIVDKASKMQALVTDACFVSPVRAEIEPDQDYADYFETEVLYRTGLSQEPNNPLLLANYAQFLYLVEHDYDRAEEYFKKAIGVELADAEAYSKYAIFLWRVRKDLQAAEETLLRAISADPGNSYYSAHYAHFLWNTDGDDTCFPLSSPDATQKEA